MEKVAHFSKIDIEEFKIFFKEYSSFCKSKTLWSEKEMLEIYNRIEMPVKEGPYYLFKNLKDFSLKPNEKVIVPLGIKAEIIDEDFILNIGKYIPAGEPYQEYSVECWNNVPFYGSGTDKQICVVVKNNTKNPIYFSEGTKIAYGVFTKIGCAF